MYNIGLLLCITIVTSLLSRPTEQEQRKHGAGTQRRQRPTACSSQPSAVAAADIFGACFIPLYRWFNAVFWHFTAPTTPSRQARPTTAPPTDWRQTPKTHVNIAFLTHSKIKKSLSQGTSPCLYTLHTAYPFQSPWAILLSCHCYQELPPG